MKTTVIAGDKEQFTRQEFLGRVNRILRDENVTATNNYGQRGYILAAQSQVIATRTLRQVAQRLHQYLATTSLHYAIASTCDAVRGEAAASGWQPLRLAFVLLRAGSCTLPCAPKRCFALRTIRVAPRSPGKRDAFPELHSLHISGKDPSMRSVSLLVACVVCFQVQHAQAQPPSEYSPTTLQPLHYEPSPFYGSKAVLAPRCQTATACPPAVTSPGADYGQPQATTYRPVWPVVPMPPKYIIGRGILGQPKLYVPGQPVRNILRYLTL
jgi:hypothetical protein